MPTGSLFICSPYWSLGDYSIRNNSDIFIQAVGIGFELFSRRLKPTLRFEFESDCGAEASDSERL